MTKSSPPRGLVRLVFRLRLGWLLGDRLLMLTHIGRKSGLLRQAVIEVVRHDCASDTYIIASGFGARGLVPQHPEEPERGGAERPAVPGGGRSATAA